MTGKYVALYGNPEEFLRLLDWDHNLDQHYLLKTLPFALTNYAYKGMLGMIDNYLFSALAGRGFFDSAKLIYGIREDEDPGKWAIDSLLWGFSLNLEVFTFLLRTVSPTHYDRSIMTRLRPFTFYSEKPWNPDAVLLL
jgi:hypothetical protein